MESIIISAVGSAKTRHGDADDAFSWQIQFVEVLAQTKSAKVESKPPEIPTTTVLQ